MASKSGNSLGGKGWGGPARGPGRGSHRAAPITQDNAAIMGHRTGTPEALVRRRRRRYQREQYLDVISEIALHGEAEANRLNAADKMLDRIEGKPKQSVDMTTAGQPVGYFNGPPVAQSIEEWEHWAKADANISKPETG